MPRKQKKKYVHVTYHQRRISVLLDKVLIFRFIRKLHGRFWGVITILIILAGGGVCFLIRPDLFRLSTAISDFGADVRTAPYFAGSMFFAAYGLWRWRNYLRRTVKRTRPILGLMTLTIVGLYLVALMPVSWRPWPYKIHFISFTVVGISMLATVVLDGLLSKTRRTPRINRWRLVRFVSVVSISLGGWLTFGSSTPVGWFHVALLGESLMLIGYALWIYIKTYLGEGERSQLSRLLKGIVLID